MHELQQDPLQSVADKFIAHRGDRSPCTFPKALWLEAFSLSKSYPISQIAQAIRVHPAYLKRKFNHLAQVSSPEKPTFAQIKLQQATQLCATQLNFQTASGTHLSFYFQAPVCDLLPLIQALAGTQK